MQYHFDWDSAKEKKNFAKHRISFGNAPWVFKDPNALTLFDKAHSQHEERWITIGIEKSGNLVVVCHTFRPMGSKEAVIRIISCRKADSTEVRQYRRERS